MWLLRNSVCAQMMAALWCADDGGSVCADDIFCACADEPLIPNGLLSDPAHLQNKGNKVSVRWSTAAVCCVSLWKMSLEFCLIHGFRNG